MTATHRRSNRAMKHPLKAPRQLPAVLETIGQTPPATAAAPATTAAAPVAPAPTVATTAAAAAPTTAAAPVATTAAPTTTAAVAPTTTAPTVVVVTVPASTTAAPTTASVARTTAIPTTATTETTTSVPQTIITQSFASGTRSIPSTTILLSSTTSASSTAAAATRGGSSITAGAIVGIVAGSLVGVVVLASMIGYYYRQRRYRNQVLEAEQFDRDDFRRESVLLDDANFDNNYAGNGNGNGNGGGATSPRMEMGQYPMTGMGPRQPSSAMGSQYNNGRSYNQQNGPPSPQLAGFNGYPQSNLGTDLYGGYPMPASQQYQLDRSLFQPQQMGTQQANYSSMPPSRSNSQQRQQADYYRQPSPQQQPQYQPQQQQQESLAYPRSSPPRINTPTYPPQSHSPLHSTSPLSSPHSAVPLTEITEEQSRSTRERSGTPEHDNVQQSYFSHHQHNESVANAALAPVNGAAISSSNGNGNGSAGSGSSRVPVPRIAVGAASEDDHAVQEKQRRLSIRNGGLDEAAEGNRRDSEDPYGGYLD